VSDGLVARLAGLAGIEPGYHDIAGTWHPTAPATARAFLEAMGLPTTGERALAAAIDGLEGLGEPTGQGGQCLSPAALGIGRAWGVACQLYGLRSARCQGIGDLADLALLAELMAAEGADFVAINPLHARFGTEPRRCSPYAPSSRRRLDPLMIAPDLAAAELGLAVAPPPVAEGELVDYPAVAAGREAALGALWRAFAARHLAGDGPTELGRAFRDWTAAEGAELERFCLFEVLDRALFASGRSAPWWDWPGGLADSRGPKARAVAAEHRAALEEHAFRQWLAERQLANVQVRARAAGMRIGLYRDLAVGVVADGADGWADPAATIRAVTVGAPPDDFSPTGQNWNLAPLSPLALRERGGAPFLDDLAASMRHAGAVRIDHAMGLMRLFWIPAGGTPADGAYVRYPLAPLLDGIARLSHQQRCLVVGEDLGTVPPVFRTAMDGAGMLSCRVVWFERWPDGLFKRPDTYPAAALASISTHDLPTVRGFLCGRDIAWRAQVGQYADAAASAAAHAARLSDIEILAAALRHEGLIGAGRPDEDAFVLALHRFLASSTAALAMVQLEDLTGEVEQANLPGTIDEHPNWRRRLPVPVEALASTGLAPAILDALRAARPR
jgi:4-alpha-glucanotransferase